MPVNNTDTNARKSTMKETRTSPQKLNSPRGTKMWQISLAKGGQHTQKENNNKINNTNRLQIFHKYTYHLQNISV
jgi:hypothetical protein